MAAQTPTRQLRRPARVRVIAGRIMHRLRWRKCRHCGQPVYSFRLRRFIKNQHAKGNDVPQAAYGVHWAHVYGEAHCGGPCSRWRRCKCTMICEDCEQPWTKGHVCD